MVSNLADVGVYTILDAHQDVLWQYGEKSDLGGYWGVPPWVKAKLQSPVHEFPWPFQVRCKSCAKSTGIGLKILPYNDHSKV